MRTAKLLVLAVLMGVMFNLSAIVQTNAEIVTTPTDFLDKTSLQISGYMWGYETSAVNGLLKPLRVLRYVQLYNDSSELIDLSEWTLSVQTLDSLGQPLCEIGVSCQTVQLPKGSKDGFLVPEQHLVIDDGTTVGGAWQGITDTAVDEFVKSKVSVQFVLSADGHQDGVLQVKPDVAPSPVDYYWQRALSSTGSGYLSSFVMSPAVPEGLFNDSLYIVPSTSPLHVVEIYPYASDCAPNDLSVFCGDYIKLHVDENADLSTLSSFVVRTDSNSSSRTISNTFHVNETMVSDDGYLTLWLDDTDKRLGLTNSGGYVWIEDLFGLKRYDETMTQYASAGSNEQGYSWVLGISDEWQWSTTPEPFGASIVTAPVAEVPTCPTGKYLNPDTGRCRTIEEAVNALSACPEGQYRNPLTNRCRQLVSTASTLAACGEGQERNPLTNRCRSISSAVAELLPCDEGYERNPATNRCRKVAGVSTTATSANQIVEPEKNTSMNVWTWSLLAVLAVGAVGYGVYEWRHELVGAAQAIAAKFGKK